MRVEIKRSELGRGYFCNAQTSKMCVLGQYFFANGTPREVLLDGRTNNIQPYVGENAKKLFHIGASGIYILTADAGYVTTLNDNAQFKEAVSTLATLTGDEVVLVD